MILILTINSYWCKYIVNPSAEDPNSPIAGMPVISVGGGIYCCNETRMSTGYAGVKRSSSKIILECFLVMQKSLSQVLLNN